MKKFLKLAVIALIFVSIFALTGCKDQYSVYIFTSSGGYVTINDQDNDKISLKEILYYNKSVNLTFNAHEKEEHQFLYWLVNSKVHSTEESITLKVSKETVIKAMFEKSNTLSITFVDENSNMLLETPLEIQANETMANFPEIPEKEGFVGNFYCGEDIMLEGNKYPYTTSKTFVLRYTQQKYTVTAEYKDCTKDDVTLTLEEGYSWDVLAGKDVKFRLTNTGNREYNIYLNSTSNQIYANAYGSYTISNIQSNQKIIIKYIKQIFEDNTDDNTSNNENNNSNNNNNQDSLIPNLDPKLPQCAISFTNNNLPTTTKIVVKLQDYEYDYKNNSYYVYKYLDFKFAIEDINLFPASNVVVKVKGKEITPNSKGIYKLDYILENTEITIDMYYNMYVSIDYGMIGTNYYEDLINADYIPYYDAVITLHHSRITNYTAKLKNDDIIVFNLNGTTKKMNIVEFIKHVNNSIETEPEYKVSHISLANQSDIIFIPNWAEISYENEISVELQQKSYFHQTKYVWHLNWSIVK